MTVSKYHHTWVKLGSGIGTHVQLLNLVGFNKTVLEIGCNTGYLSRVMQWRGCHIVGVELDEDAARLAQPFCQKIIVTNVETLDWQKTFQHQKFDVIMFGDVLEHLLSPPQVLKNARNYLNLDGYIIVSVPNIAHGSIRLGLLLGIFDYTLTGILDETHLHFFTKQTAQKMLEASGFKIRNISSVVESVSAELTNRVLHRYPSLTIDTIQNLLSEPDAQAFQYIFTAIPISQTQSATPVVLNDAINNITVIVHNNSSNEVDLIRCLESILENDVAQAQINIISRTALNNVSQKWNKYSYSEDEGLFVGINRIIATLNTDIVLLLDASITLTPTIFTAFINRLQGNPTTAVVGGAVLHSDRRTINQFGGYLSPPIAQISRRGQNYFFDDGLWDQVTSVDFVFPELMAFRVASFKEIGGFDSKYKTIYAVVDLCKRLWQRKYQIVIDPDILSTSHFKDSLQMKNLLEVEVERLTFISYQMLDNRMINDFLSAEKEYLNNVESKKILTVHQLAYFKKLLTAQEDTRQLIWKQLLQETKKVITMKEKHPEPIPLKLHQFNSSYPVIGKMVSLFRQWWGNIAARWYTEDIVLQQKEINQTLFKQIHAVEEQLSAQEEILSHLVDMLTDGQHQSDP